MNSFRSRKLKWRASVPSGLSVAKARRKSERASYFLSSGLKITKSFRDRKLWYTSKGEAEWKLS